MLIISLQRWKTEATNNSMWEEHRQTILSSCKIQPPSVTQKKYIVLSNAACQKNKRICSTNSEFECNCKVLQEQFTKRGYDSSFIETEIKKIKLLDSKYSLTPKTTQKPQVLPLTVAYNRTLPNIK